ncbi:MAG: ADOP family duplicated permease [Gemmatimonadetes bacterium]|nr:ADOP family duplicated permease [Gemmatimonadota bacterium]MDA1102939.1 ADOP family duplicated permease [Gemmatimonadota bacterium]
MVRPPPLAVRLLEWRVPEQVRTYLLGDLEETFRSKANESPIRASLWYWRQALSALFAPLPGTVGVERGGPNPGLLRDTRHAIRALKRHPTQSLAAVLTLGLGVGVVGTAFSILWGTVLAGLPFEDPDRLVHFERAALEDGRNSLAVTPHDYVAWSDAQRSFEALGAYVEATALMSNDQAPPDRYVGVRMSASSFELLRVQPALGRGFSQEDESPGAPQVILLSDRLWRSRFAADAGVVGRTVDINGLPTTVVGVMPERFGFPIAEEFWLPLRLDFSTIERGSGRLDVFGRLAGDQELASAHDEFSRITGALAEAYPETNRGITAQLRSFSDEYVGDEFANTVYRLVAGALLVLLICCANVANLLLIRGVRRRRELAVRMSLGATHGLIVRQLLTESFVLAALGGLIGIGVASLGVSWFNRVGTQAGVFDLPHGSDSLFWWDVSLDGPVMLAVLAAAALTAVLAGAAPSMRIARSTHLLRGGRAGNALAGGGRVTSALVVVQLTLTGALTVAAAFVAKSVWNVAGADAGFATEAVVVTRVDLPVGRYGGNGSGDHSARLRFVSVLLDELDADPAVVAAAVTSDVPTDLPITQDFRIDGDGVGPDVEREVGVVSVTASYFDVFGVDPTDGRVFGPGDGEGGAPVTLVNETFARLYLSGRSAVGSRVRLGPIDSGEPWRTVVGVVPDLWARPGEPLREAGVYVPLEQSAGTDPTLTLGVLGLRYPTVAVQLCPGSVNVSDVLRAAVYRVDGAVPVRRVQTMSDFVGQRMGRYQVWGRFYLCFSALALLLVAVGVYGVLSFGVLTRTGEIGVRRALGASQGSVQREILRGAVRQLGIGIAAGVALGVVLVRGLTSVLYGVETNDISVFVGAALLLGTVGLLASWLPARRAARIDPLEAIRTE